MPVTVLLRYVLNQTPPFLALYYLEELTDEQWRVVEENPNVALYTEGLLPGSESITTPYEVIHAVHEGKSVTELGDLYCGPAYHLVKFLSELKLNRLFTADSEPETEDDEEGDADYSIPTENEEEESDDDDESW